MTSTVKTPKEKPPTITPRFAPRQTAASVARAARNATNRNLTLQPSQRQSPPRISGPTKPKSPLQRTQKSDSKSDIKINRNLENEGASDFDVSASPHAESFVGDNSTVVIIEEPSDEPVEYQNTDNAQNELNEPNARDVTETNESILPNRNETIPEYAPKSRPRTPSIRSRPQTPKSIHSSRPQTPRISSRPTTPAHPATRHGAGVTSSRPNTPQQSRLPLTTAPPPNSRTITPSSQTCTIVKDDEDIKSVYTVKQRQFSRLKKDLDMKQQAVLEVFDCLRNLRERMSREGISGGGEGLQQQELVVFNVADWAADEVAQLCRDATASFATDASIQLISTIAPIDECTIDELENKVSNIPSRFADLCLQAFTSRQELMDWVKELIEKNEDGSGESLGRIARYNAQGFELCEALRDLKNHTDNAIYSITQITRRACRERSVLMNVGETLVRETAHLRQELESRTTTVHEMREIRTETDTIKALEVANHDLEEERAMKATLKDKLSTAESQLRQTRIRVTKMDRQLREAEASIASLTGTVKSLEDQSRQREVQLEARARKLKESLKTGEVASGHIAQHRDALQVEVLDLKERVEIMSGQHKALVQDLNNEIKELVNTIEEHKKKIQDEEELNLVANKTILERDEDIKELKDKITELENSRPNPELPTEREMDLWADLQATKDTLRITEEEVTACKREKVRFLETLTKITDSESKVGMQQKLAAELLSKEEIVGKMQIQIRELTKNIKLNEQKVIQYEQYVRDLQAHNCAVANCQETPNGISYQDLQQEIMALKMNLLETVHRNEELSEMLVQKEQQLEQQDKTSRAQARVIKVREELINMLKNKETEQSRELVALQQDLEHRMKIVDEVNKQIAAKAVEIQELFTTLENKQQQIHRLEKIVLALEEQQRRAQAQRTRHEEKIAALEHELAASGNRRERKFIFF